MRNRYIPTTLRIHEEEEDSVSSEFIHVRLDAIPPLKIIGEYMEPTTLQKDAEESKKELTDEVQRCVDLGENCMMIGDTNAAVNEDSSKRTHPTKQMLAWEASKKVILQPTRVPYVKSYQSNCLDMGIITPGLEKLV